MNDRLFRVVLPDPELLQRVRDLYADFVYDSDALLGFQMSKGGGGLWSLIAGTGQVLARSRDNREVLGSLLNFIDEIAAPPPPEGVVRLAMRAVVRTDGSGATLFGPHAHVFGTLVERRLERAGLAVVDARFSDVEIGDSVPRLAVPASRRAAGPTGVGHMARHSAASIIRRVVLPEVAWNQSEPNTAMIAANLAGATRSGGLASRLLVAGQLANVPEVVVGHVADIHR